VFLLQSVGLLCWHDLSFVGHQVEVLINHSL
jgi:hypothetical protein